MANRGQLRPASTTMPEYLENSFSEAGTGKHSPPADSLPAIPAFPTQSRPPPTRSYQDNTHIRLIEWGIKGMPSVSIISFRLLGSTHICSALLQSETFSAFNSVISTSFHSEPVRRYISSSRERFIANIMVLTSLSLQAAAST